MVIDENARTICLKFVFVGPALAGKMTVIRHIHDFIALQAIHGGLHWGGPNSLYFNPPGTPMLGGLTLWLHLHIAAVPAAPTDDWLRAPLENADGIVFVADSQSERLAANGEILVQMNAVLAGRPPIPRAFWFNKRDCPSALPCDVLAAALTTPGDDYWLTEAIHGVEVMAAFRMSFAWVYEATCQRLHAQRRPR